MRSIENDVMQFALDFAANMKWDIPEIIRIKINRMERCLGWCIPDTQSDGVYILLSEKTCKSNHQFFATLIHELIHAVLVNSKHWKKSHKHGRCFQKLAKQVEKKTNGFFTVKEIME